MSNSSSGNCCRICGLDQSFPIWGETGSDPSFAICPCCGVEFGYEDIGKEDCISFRTHWIEEKGADWWEPREKPLDWSLEEQLRNIPDEYK